MKNDNQDLKLAIDFLKAWTRSEWKDFIKENSPLLHNTNKFIEDVERRYFS